MIECRFSIYSLFMDIHNSFMDIHRSFMNIINEFWVHKSFWISIDHTCKAKRGRRPRVRSTPIDNTYVQVNNVLFTWLMIFKKLSNMVPLSPQWYPLTMPIFLSQTRAGTQQSCTQKFSKLREWFVIHSFLILILKIFFLDQNMQ